MAILVVVDMQPAFSAARNVMLKRRICKTIREWPGPVCIVEYRNSGKTWPCIMRAAESKKGSFVVEKREDDGGDLVVAAARDMGHGRHRHFTLTGVNTAYCVIGTACGILRARRDSKVTLYLKGCRNQQDFSQREPTFAAAHVWAREDRRGPRRKWRRFLRVEPI